MQRHIDTTNLSAMPFNRPDTTALPFAYPSNSQQYTTMKGPDPLSGNWTYDNAIELFSANTMMQDPFSMDLPSEPINLDPAYFPVDPFAAPEFNGFAISNKAEDSVSCQSPSVSYLAGEYGMCMSDLTQDLDSDDQMWSPSCPTFSPPEPTLDMPVSHRRTRTMELPPSRRESTQSKRGSVSTISSSPEIAPQDQAEPIQPTQPTAKMTRMRSKGSSTSSSQQPNARNAAKRAAHNVIEKRYRTNMNAKFLALEQAISGGGVQKPTKGETGSLKKSEILANAIAYMQQLQEENKALHKEMVFLKQNCIPRGAWRSRGGR